MESSQVILGSGKTVIPENSMVPRHIIRFATGLIISGGLETVFGIVLAMLSTVEAILQGGSISFFSGPPLGFLALAIGIVAILAGKSATPKRLRKLLIAVALFNSIVGLACLVLFIHSCLAASWIAQDYKVVTSLYVHTTTYSPAASTQPGLVEAYDLAKSDNSPQTAFGIIVASAVFYLLLTITAVVSLVLACLNLCCISRSAMF